MITVKSKKRKEIFDRKGSGGLLPSCPGCQSGHGASGFSDCVGHRGEPCLHFRISVCFLPASAQSSRKERTSLSLNNRYKPLEGTLWEVKQYGSFMWKEYFCRSNI